MSTSVYQSSPFVATSSEFRFFRHGDATYSLPVAPFPLQRDLVSPISCLESQDVVSSVAASYGLVNGGISARCHSQSEKDDASSVNPHPEEITPVAVGVVKPGGISVGKQDKTAVRKPPQASRGVVTGRSSESRRRLMEYLASIDMTILASERKDARYCKASFITLTYPADFPGWRQAKEDLRTWKERLRRNFPFRWAVWVEEFQKRGAVHFHLIVVFTDPVDLKAFRPWLSESWYEVVGSEDPKHLRAGTQSVAVHIEDGVGSLMGYLAGEMGKIKQTRPVDPQTGELIETGRTWGFWYKENVPFETFTEVVFWTWEAWKEFKGRVSKHFSKSAYLSKVWTFRSWQGALLYGAGQDLFEKLIEGIEGIQIGGVPCLI